jgi:hypothetical protein
MKKTLLSVVALLGLTAATAQVYTANDSTAFAEWTAYDLDLDGAGFSAATTNGTSATSYSYDNATGALTPDNLFISPAIDLSTGSNVMLNFDVTALDQSWVSENYAVYIVTDLVAIVTGTFPTAVHEEVVVAGLLTRNIDVSAVADGEATVYVVIRHYNCTDMFGIGFNNLSITGDFLSVEEASSLEVLSAYPNPSTDVLNVTFNSNVETVSILSLDGKLISNEVVNANNVTLKVANLASGVYFYEAITTEGNKLRNKFIKK